MSEGFARPQASHIGGQESWMPRGEGGQTAPPRQSPHSPVHVTCRIHVYNYVHTPTPSKTGHTLLVMNIYVALTITSAPLPLPPRPPPSGSALPRLELST